VTGGTFIGKTGFDIRAGTVSISNAIIEINQTGTVDSTGMSGPSSFGMGIAIYDYSSYSMDTAINVTVNDTFIIGATYDIYCGEFKLSSGGFDNSAFSGTYTASHNMTLNLDGIEVFSSTIGNTTLNSHVYVAVYLTQYSGVQWFVDSSSASGILYLEHGTEHIITAQTNNGYAGDARISLSGATLNGSSFTVGYSAITATETGVARAVTLTLSASEGGTVTGSGIYGVGDRVTVSAVPADGYEFVSWSDKGAQTHTITVMSNITLTAVFEKACIVSLEADGNGTVTGSGTYVYGTKVIISAVPADGYEFVSWSDKGAQTHTITVMSDTILTAVFKEVAGTTYIISVSHSGNGTVTGNTTVASGANSVFTIIADTDNKVSDVIVDGSSVGVVGSYIFSNVISDHTISVVFEGSKGASTIVSDDGEVTETVEILETDGTTGNVSRTTTTEGNVKVIVELESSDNTVTTTAIRSNEGSSIHTTVSVESVASGDASEAMVDDSAVAEVLKQAQLAASAVGDDATVIVVISVVSDSSSSITDVTVSPDSLSNLAEAGVGVEISTGTGTVTMDNSVLSNLEGNSLTVSIGKVDTSSLTEAQKEAAGDMVVIQASAMSGDGFVHELGGMVTITVPYELRSGENPDDVQVLYLKDDGTTQTYSAIYNSDTGTVSFQTDHFSYYVITFESSESIDIALYIIAAVIVVIVAVVIIYWFMYIRKSE